MKIKSILRIAAFSTAFVASAAFANLFADRSDYRSNSPAADASPRGYRQTSSSDLQRRIWLFLDEDRANGAALENEVNGAATPDKLANELAATVNLAIKMNGTDAADLPPDFRVAWKNHVAAWDAQASFLHRAVKIRSSNMFTGGLRDEYLQNDAEITRTYYALLDVAEEYGVDFPR